MVIDPQDLVRAIDIIEEYSQQQGRPNRPPVGIMIETPAAVILLDRLLEHVDFLSVGTNDLVQYVLAADRSAIDLDNDYSLLHPAIVRTMDQLVTQCVAAKKPLSVCGEAAGDPKIACLLAGMGIRQLSMSPVRAARVRSALRKQSIKQLEALALEILQSGTTAQARSLLEQQLTSVSDTERR
jgi:phosphoenolpyruvate-protein kinase (PTS system EI component)